MNRLSGKAGRAQEHRRKQFVANFEVSTIFASCFYIFYTFLYFCRHAGAGGRPCSLVWNPNWTQVLSKASYNCFLFTIVHEKIRSRIIFSCPCFHREVSGGTPTSRGRETKKQTGFFVFVQGLNFSKTIFFVVELLIQWIVVEPGAGSGFEIPAWIPGYRSWWWTDCSWFPPALGQVLAVTMIIENIKELLM